MKRFWLKGFVILTFVVLGASSLSAQPKSDYLYLTTFDQRPLHFGFSLGFNWFDANIQTHSPSVGRPSYVMDVGRLNSGFTVGIIANWRLGDWFDLRFLPGISLGSREISYRNTTYSILSEHSNWDLFHISPRENQKIHGVNDSTLTIETTYLDFPLLIKYKAMRIRNLRPYIVTGPALRYDISKSDKEQLGLKPLDVYWEVGVGLDNYLKYFKLAPELKMSFGLKNILGSPKKDNSDLHNSIKRFSSNIVTLCFHFE